MVVGRVQANSECFMGQIPEDHTSPRPSPLLSGAEREGKPRGHLLPNPKLRLKEHFTRFAGFDRRLRHFACLQRLNANPHSLGTNMERHEANLQRH